MQARNRYSSSGVAGTTFGAVGVGAGGAGSGAGAAGGGVFTGAGAHAARMATLSATRANRAVGITDTLAFGETA